MSEMFEAQAKAAQAKAPAAAARLHWLDAARGAAMLLVAVGHYVPAQLYGNALVWGVLRWIYAFHVPLFFFLSGITLQPERGPFLLFAAHKARALLLPWACFLALGAALRLGSGSLPLSEVPRAFLYGNLATPAAWFLPVLFCTQLLWAALVRLARRVCGQTRAFCGTLAVCAALLWGLGWAAAQLQWKWPFYAQTVPCCLVFLALGAAAKFLPLVPAWRPAAQAGVGAGCLAVCGVLAQCWPVCYSLADLVLPSYPLFLLMALLGSAGTVLCCMALSHTRLLEAWGRHSLLICLTHGYWVAGYGLLGPLLRPLFAAERSYQLCMLALGAVWFCGWMLLYVPLGGLLTRCRRLFCAAANKNEKPLDGKETLT